MRTTVMVRSAAIVCAAAGIFAVVSVARAIRTDDRPGPADATALGDIQPLSRPAGLRANITAAVDADPFAPSRQRPLEAY